MATIFNYGTKNTVIEQQQKEAFIREIMQKIVEKLRTEPKKMLLLPPDMTRLHSR